MSRDTGIDAVAELAAMKRIQKDGNNGCEIVVASLRSAAQMVELAGHGLSVFTIAPGIAEELISEARSKEAHAAFEEAARG